MNELKHTPEPQQASIEQVAPTPWKPDSFARICIRDASGQLLDFIVVRDLIVHRVNAHEELLAALQEAYPPGSRLHNPTCPFVRHGDLESCNCREARAHATIAAAKE